MFVKRLKFDCRELTITQGGSANRAQEYILQAMYLNVLHDLQNLAPAAALFHGASHDRLGKVQKNRRTLTRRLTAM